MPAASHYTAPTGKPSGTDHPPESTWHRPRTGVNRVPSMSAPLLMRKNARSIDATCRFSLVSSQASQAAIYPFLWISRIISPRDKIFSSPNQIRLSVHAYPNHIRISCHCLSLSHSACCLILPISFGVSMLDNFRTFVNAVPLSCFQRRCFRSSLRVFPGAAPCSFAFPLSILDSVTFSPVGSSRPTCVLL